MTGRDPRAASAAPLLIGFCTVVLALLGLLWMGPPPASTRPVCTDEVRRDVRLPPQPGAEGGAGPELIAAGNKLSLRGRLDAAERLYDRALALDDPDQRAGLGLAYVEARRALSVDRANAGQRALTAGRSEEAAACFRLSLVSDRGNQVARDALELMRPPDTRSLVQQLADGWDAFYERWLAPTARALVPFLVTLAVLLVLARLFTPVAVPREARAWPDRVRAAVWWAGVALLAVAALRMTAFAGRGPSPWEQWPADHRRIAVLAGLLLLAALLVHRSRTCSWTRRWPVLLALVLVGVLALPVALVAAAVRGRETPAVPDGLWPWALSAGLAALGVVLVALGRGHALRLQVTVKQAGKTDPVATDYVLARLEELGTAPPEGLKAPQQVDVTDLPTDALTSLPAGKVAAALTTALGLLRASVPWRAVVADTGADRMVVTVTRNGHVVRTAIVDGERFRGPTASSPEAGATAEPARNERNLLTASAAVILTELAVRHPRLGRGLCGATQWDSVAAHVVATRPARPRDDDFGLRLLAFALQRDPRNALARAAYVQRMTAAPSSAQDFRRQAERLTALLGTIECQRLTDPAGRPLPYVRDDDGYLPLRLRTYHSLTAARLNAAVSDGGDGEDRRKAKEAFATFRELLALPAAGEMADIFLAELTSVREELEVALSVIDPDRRDTGFPGRFTWFAPRSPHALFDRACSLARDAECSGATHLNNRRGRRQLALEDLRLAAGEWKLKEQARRDPWLRSLTVGAEDDDVPTTFWQVVGNPTPGFTDLAPFGDKGAGLRALGLTGPQDLCAATEGDMAPRDLARRLDVPLSVIKRWVRLAELAKPPAGGDWLDSRHLAILVGAGITSVGDLPETTTPDQLGAFRKVVDKSANGLAVRPLTRTELETIRARA